VFTGVWHEQHRADERRSCTTMPAPPALVTLVVPAVIALHREYACEIGANPVWRV
jgi:hypothetical protein